jgi:alpha-beta hydrolase superfamily lysophospholipase
MIKAMRFIILILTLLCFQGLAWADALSESEFDVFVVLGLSREQGHLPKDFNDKMKANFPKATVHYMDLPGAGIYFQETVPDSIEGMVEFLRNKNEAHFANKNRKRILIATSLAGIVEAEWLNRYPQDFDGGVMIASSFKNICRFFERTQLTSLMRMIKIPLSGKATKRETLVAKININDKGQRQGVVQQNVEVQKLHPMTKKNMMRQVSAAKKYELEGKIEVPILLMGSYADRLVKPECIEKSSEHFGATLKMHNTSGHGIPVEATDWMLDNIKSWLNETYF